jgi:hypothetical protein
VLVLLSSLHANWLMLVHGQGGRRKGSSSRIRQVEGSRWGTEDVRARRAAPLLKAQVPMKATRRTRAVGRGPRRMGEQPVLAPGAVLVGEEGEVLLTVRVAGVRAGLSRALQRQEGEGLL